MSLSRASRMLAALREELADELFVRSGNRLFPTPRARELLPAMQRLLDDFEAVKLPGGFSPERESRIVTVGCLDLDLVSILNGVLPELRAAAPGIRINFVEIDGGFHRELRRGRYDIVFYPTSENYPGVKKLAVCEDAFVFVCLAQSELGRRKRGGGRITERDVLERLGVQVTVPVYKELRQNKLNQLWCWRGILHDMSATFNISSERLKKFIGRMIPLLNERDRRLFAGSVAELLGHGGQKYVRETTGMSSATVSKGRANKSRSP